MVCVQIDTTDMNCGLESITFITLLTFLNYFKVIKFGCFAMVVLILKLQ